MTFIDFQVKSFSIIFLRTQTKDSFMSWHLKVTIVPFPKDRPRGRVVIGKKKEENNAGKNVTSALQL